MIKQTLEFSTRKDAQLFPVALNSFHSAIDPAQLLPNEVVVNKDVIRTPNGELTTHPKWKYIKVNGCTKLLADYHVATMHIEKQFLVFGHYEGIAETQGFIGRIKEDDIIGVEVTVEKLLINLNQYIVPMFVAYKKGIYITLGPQGIYYYDGESVVNKSTGAGDLEGIYASVGASLRGRLWLAGLIGDPGTAKLTKIGTEEIDTTVVCGDNGEIITGLMPNGENMVLVKDKEVYEYRWSDDIGTGILETHSLKVGCSYHTLLQKHFDMIYMTDKQGTYILNPRGIKATGREVVVEKNIITISDPIKDILNDFKTSRLIQKAYTKENFENDDFLWKTNVTVVSGAPRIMKASKTIMVESFTPDASYSCKKDYVYCQGYFSDHDYIGTDIYLKMAKSQVATGTEIKITVREDDNGVLGDEIAHKTIDTSSWGVTPGWYTFQIEMWDGAPFEFRKDTPYWVQFENLSAAVEYTWYLKANAARFLRYTDDPEFPWTTWEFTFQVYGEWYLKDDESYVISDSIELPGIDYWQSFNVGEIKPVNTDIVYYIREFDDSSPTGNWVSITPGGLIPDSLRFKSKLQWKAILSSTDYVRTPKITAVYFYGICFEYADTFIGSGFRNNRYYIFGKDTNDNDVFLCFAKDGWLKIDESDDNFIYGQCHNDIEVNNFKILGVGRAPDDDRGCLLYALDTDDSDYLNMPIHIKTGRLLLNEIPKKGRKIFIIYQGESVVLKCYTEHGVKTFNLEDTNGNFNTEEFGFGTSRSKYFELEITANKDFKQKKMSLNFKAHKAQEV